MSAARLKRDDILTRIDELPTLPTIVYELNQVISDPMSSTKDVERIMENDQALTTKVLKLVNSAYYAIPGGVSNLARAVGYIGFDTVHQLVLSASIIKALETKGPSKFDVNQFWKHSVGVAMASEVLAQVTGHPMPTDMFTCGLVHDMGKVALLNISSDALNAIVDHCEENAVTFYEAERQLEAIPHTEVGRMLSEKWRLPFNLQACIKHHHQPDPRLRGSLSNDMAINVDIVLLANLLIHGLKFGASGHSKVLGAPKDLLQRLGLGSEKFKEALKEIKNSLENAAGFIQVLGE